MGFFRLPFASQLQIVLLVGMILAFLLIAQNQSVDVYGYGLILLIGFSLLQVVGPSPYKLLPAVIRASVTSPAAAYRAAGGDRPEVLHRWAALYFGDPDRSPRGAWAPGRSS